MIANTSAESTTANVEGSGTVTAGFAIPYVPVNLSTSGTTPSPFQQMLDVGGYSTFTYNGVTYNGINQQWSNVEFTSDGPCTSQSCSGVTPLQAWCETGCSGSGSATVWVKLPSGFSGSTTIYMNLMPNDVMSASGPTGEAPQLSPNYAEYDNGGLVFAYYNPAPSNTNGWTISGGGLGQTSSAPAGSYFGSTDAYVVPVGNQNYMYTSIPTLSSGEIITYWNYATTNGCADYFFLVNSGGAGQFARIDERSGSDTGILPTSSWTLWGGNGDIADPTSPNWYKVDIVVPSSTTAIMYLSSTTDTPIGTLGPSNTGNIGISDNGDYMGFQSDGCSGSNPYYWNGFVVRAYPPGGSMPNAIFSSVQ